MTNFNEQLMLNLNAAQKKFAEGECEEGKKQEEQALKYLLRRRPHPINELLAIHYCYSGYLVYIAEIEKLLHPQNGVQTLEAMKTAYEKVIAQFEKGYAWIQQLNLSLLNRETRLFLAQSRFCAGIIKMNGILGSETRKDAKICFDEAKKIMRTNPTCTEDYAYIQNYSSLQDGLKAILDGMKTIPGAPDSNEDELSENEETDDESSLSENEMEQIVEPILSEEKKQFTDKAVEAITRGDRSFMPEYYYSYAVSTQNNINVHAEAALAARLFAERAQKILAANKHSIWGNMKGLLHFSPASDEKSTFTVDVKITHRPSFG